MKGTIAILVFLCSLKGAGQQKFDLYFDFNKEVPNEQSMRDYQHWIAQNKEVEIIKLLGYCDSIDTKEYNKELAERRMANVQVLLETKGVKMNASIQRVAYGKDFIQSRIQAENRRVTLYYNEIKQPIRSELSERIAKSNVGETVKLPNIYFFNNVARILPKSEPSLYDLLCVMEENPTLKIEIQGHICCQTVFDLNDVSLSRARAIYMFLIRNKIDKKRMTFKGYGSSKPVHPIPEKSAQEEEDNRRVEIMILEK